MSKKRLGRGLDALLSERTPTSEPASQARGAVGPGAKTDAAISSPEIGIPIADIQPSPYQPRRHFDNEALTELANSIANQGLLQPVVVRARPQGGYELIAGERRWRAAKQVGLTKIPAVIRTISDAEASAFGLIENMQREDLNAMEEAMGLARLRDEFELTQQQIADAVGKSRVTIANLLRLMNLGSTAKRLLETGELEMGHARALLALDGLAQDQTAQRVADQGLSVRQTEVLVRNVTQGTDKKAPTPQASKDADTRRLEQRMTETIGAPVSIKHSTQGKGEVTIKYSSLDELDGVLKHLGFSD
jgi:ParB family chromosome partitioning protein